MNGHWLMQELVLWQPQHGLVEKHVVYVPLSLDADSSEEQMKLVAAACKRLFVCLFVCFQLLGQILD